MSFFQFNGKRNHSVVPLQGVKRPAWAPLERTFLEVPHYPGGRLIRTQTKMRKIVVPVALLYNSPKEAEKLKEEIADWLITEQPQELIFDDERDRTFLAIIDESFDLDQLVNLGEGTLTFICAMPYKLGAQQSVDFELDGRGLIANVTNKGTVQSHPIIEVEVEKPSTFLDVWNGKDYFRIGYPLKANQLPVERNQRVLWDEMTTTIGWSKVSEMEDGQPVGEMKSDNYQFYCSDYGTGKAWHGAAVKKNIPGGPKQDFIMQSYVTCKSTARNQMGRVEIAILDENSKVLSKIAMNDVFWEAEQNVGTMVIGYDGKPGRTTLIHESGDHPTTWNQYFGRLWIARTGNVWEAYISKFLSETERDDSERFVRWIDEEKYHMAKAAQIQISIMQWQDVPPVEKLTVSDIKFWKVNMNTQGNLPYIADKGDKIVIDKERRSVTIEGKSASNIKDFFSSFPIIHKGKNKLEIMPPNIGKAKVTYRERYK
ncbi:distal tail protein Dit [Bacillus sp. FDAARGOS_1420]|uniref:distal tail protein Dit n=1 Tax=unclassified Bacillus (in: firmicutes) TaxID=185979 RepID=UPI001C5A8E39|nr:distal tail protein Dit [Bacillus sp. FDAARGOS_1420]MBW3493253.1 phage tail family protein [Bacillus sp. FDAARGOS_1420]